MSSCWEGVETRVEALEQYVYDLEKRVKESLSHASTANESILKALRAIEKILKIELGEEGK